MNKEIIHVTGSFSLDSKLEELYEQFYEKLQETVNTQSLSKREVFKQVKDLYRNTSILLQKEVDNYLN